MGDAVSMSRGRERHHSGVSVARLSDDVGWHSATIHSVGRLDFPISISVAEVPCIKISACSLSGPIQQENAPLVGLSEGETKSAAPRFPGSGECFSP